MSWIGHVGPCRYTALNPCSRQCSLMAYLLSSVFGLQFYSAFNVLQLIVLIIVCKKKWKFNHLSCVSCDFVYCFARTFTWTLKMATMNVSNCIDLVYVPIWFVGSILRGKSCLFIDINVIVRYCIWFLCGPLLNYIFYTK